MKVTSKELRKRAWKKLSDGNYGLSLRVTFIGSMVAGAGSIFTFGAMMQGVSGYFIDQQRGKKPEFMQAFEGFNDYVNNLVTCLLQMVFLFLWSLLLLVPGIIYNYATEMVYFIRHDHPELSGTEALDYCKRLMDGYKFDLFCLNFSFIGWILLSMLTCGVGAVLLMPYIYAAKAEFYAQLLVENGEQSQGVGLGKDNSIEEEPFEL